MSKHTPGPWSITPDAPTQVEADGIWVGDASRREVGSEQALANARLISAAPDLLEALGEARKALAVLINPGAEYASVQAVFAQATATEARARAAIAKARGEDQ